jgi:putative transposase
MNKGNRYSEEQILKVLGEVEGGESIASVARRHGINTQTIGRWRSRFAGMSKSELMELRELQKENQRLRNVVARQAVELEAYKEIAKGKW